MFPLNHWNEQDAKLRGTKRPCFGRMHFAWLLVLAVGCNGSEDRPRPLKEALEAANQKAREIVEQVSPPTQSNATASRIARTPDGPVDLEFAVAPSTAHAGAVLECRIVLDIGPGWSVHPLDALPPALPTRIELELPPGFTRDGKWQQVSGNPSKGPAGEDIIDGRAEWKQLLRIAPECQPGSYSIGCFVKYQACNAKQCLRPIQGDLGAIVEIAD